MTGSNRFLIISNIIKHIYIYPIYCQNRIIILHMIPKCIIFQIILHQSPSWATLSWGPVIRKAWQPLVPFVARRGSCGPWSPAGICGKSMGNLWEICEIYGKSMGNPRENMVFTGSYICLPPFWRLSCRSLVESKTFRIAKWLAKKSATATALQSSKQH